MEWVQVLWSLKQEGLGMSSSPDRKEILRRRCAIYTRKSTDEGLDMEFNSLDAQREACSAYITSQKAEGWVSIREPYDDGGFSGGTLDRPALQRLLSDVEVGLVDVIVVYKIDRLSRSLMDFARLVEILDRHNVTFVSVTQSFNTTTSMGRLTLNILLSFAQFDQLGSHQLDLCLLSIQRFAHICQIGKAATLGNLLVRVLYRLGINVSH